MKSITYALLFIFVFTIPWHAIVVINEIGTLTRILGMGLILIAILNVFTLKRVKELPLLIWLITVYVGWSLISFLWTVNETSTIMRFVTNIQLLAMVWLIWQVCDSEKEKRGMMFAYVMGAYVSIYYLLHIYITEQFTGFRISLENFDPNDLATTIAMGIPLSWYLFYQTKRFIGQLVLLMFSPLAFFSIVLTASRGGLLVALISLSVIPLLFTRLTTIKQLMTGAGIILVIIISLLNSNDIQKNLENNIERLQGTPDMIRAGDLNYRQIIWSAGITIFSQNPIIGVGAGGFPHAIEPYLHRKLAPHNAYLSVLVDTGIIGFVLFISCFIIAAIPIRWYSFEARVSYLILILTLLIGMIPLGWEYQKITWFVLSLFLLQGGYILKGNRIVYFSN